MIRKLYRHKATTNWGIIEKAGVDKIIFRATKARDRLMLELMVGGGMRIGEILKLQKKVLQDLKLVLKLPKSGKERSRLYSTEAC